MKALTIAWKDTITRLRDWRAIVGFIVAPLAISAVIGLAFGGTFRAETAIQDIKLVIVNLDSGELGQVYSTVLTSDDLVDLFLITEMDDYEAALELVETGETRGVVYIPEDFSDELFANVSATDGSYNPVSVEVTTDPASSISPFIITSVVDQISVSINTLLLSGQVGVEQVLAYAAQLGPELAELANIVPGVIEQAATDPGANQLGLDVVQVGEAQQDISPFSYFAPSMAIFFLMFSMTDGARSILQEETRGTLPRLITTPTPFAEIILGKIGGTFLTGIIQFIVLVLASSLLFGLNWGPSPLALALLVLATVSASTGLGALISSITPTEAQAGIVGSSVTMVFAALGGNFALASALPDYLQIPSRLTINRWSLDGFVKLANDGRGLEGVLPEIGVLFVMAVVFFVLSVVLFQRRFVR
ncbi:MAG: ABC transporter permease [Chloroflexi bacterium]|nr:MAG: ABC transporter permease [Chloroflexota bacterium]MBL1197125.1 ABC transporter permease [Chloroflexota bacterium]NOH14420.1 ABC transporter permease [Chloroflexota bacterium]